MSERSQAAAGRTIAVTGLGLLLVAVVGLASSGSPWHGASSEGNVSANVVRALAAGAGVLVVAALILVWVGTPSTQRQKRRRRRLGARDLEELGASLSTAGKAAAVVAGAVGLFLLISLLFVAPKATPPPAAGAGVTAPTERPTAGVRPAGQVESRSLAWLVVSAAAALVLLAPAAVLVRRRRARRARAPVIPDVASQVGSGLRGSLEELEAERDPRLAIRRAYERMEESFGAVQLVRAPDETPSEFTARVLRAVGAGAAPASELTGLFELARFSDHTLDEDDRRRAIASVRQIEAEVVRQ